MTPAGMLAGLVTCRSAPVRVGAALCEALADYLADAGKYAAQLLGCWVPAWVRALIRIGWSNCIQATGRLFAPRHLVRPAAGRLLWDEEDAFAELAGHGRRLVYLGHLDVVKPGQKRRLAISRVVLSVAPVWLPDEPTLGLDTLSIERFGGVLQAHRADGGMVVAAMHVPLPLVDAAGLRLG
jgi:hypothetical protein